MRIQPKLHEVPIPESIHHAHGVVATISKGQWDMLTEAMYEQGAVLLEIGITGGKEVITKAFQKPKTEEGAQ